MSEIPLGHRTVSLRWDVHFLPETFKGQRERTLFGNSAPIMGWTHSRLPCTSQREDNSPRALPPASPALCYYIGPPVGAHRHTSMLRDLSPTPFTHVGAMCEASHGNFLHSSLQSSCWNIYYFHHSVFLLFHHNPLWKAQRPLPTKPLAPNPKMHKQIYFCYTCTKSHNITASLTARSRAPTRSKRLPLLSRWSPHITVCLTETYICSARCHFSAL